MTKAIKELNIEELESVSGGEDWKDLTPEVFYEVVMKMHDTYGFDIAQKMTMNFLNVDPHIYDRRYVHNNNYKQYWSEVTIDLYNLHYYK